METKQSFRDLEYIKTKQGKQDLINQFLRNLDKAIYDAKDMLIERFEYICSQSPKSAQFMYENK